MISPESFRPVPAFTPFTTRARSFSSLAYHGILRRALLFTGNRCRSSAAPSRYSIFMVSQNYFALISYPRDYFNSEVSHFEMIAL
jgi:hypothetical protein